MKQTARRVKHWLYPDLTDTQKKLHPHGAIASVGLILGLSVGFLMVSSVFLEQGWAANKVNILSAAAWRCWALVRPFSCIFSGNVSRKWRRS